MPQKNSPLNITSADFEKAAIEKFRSLATSVPKECRVFREPWGRSTVLCLDFQACPDLLEVTREQAYLSIAAARELELAKSLIFRLGNKVIGWTAVTAAT